MAGPDAPGGRAAPGRLAPPPMARTLPRPPQERAMAVTETGPSSSYSDPIYDRLDTVAQRLARRWALVVLVILGIVAGSLVARYAISEDSTTASLQAYL